MAELQSRILLSKIPAAITRIDNEKPRLESIAKATFDAVIQDRPETFLRADMAKEGVTLEVMTELYQQARHAGAIAGPEVESAAQLFEHCRVRGIDGRGGWLLRRNSKLDAAQLRYLMASLEEINRINGWRLLLSEAHQNGASLERLRQEIQQSQETSGLMASAPDAVGAYIFAKVRETRQPVTV